VYHIKETDLRYHLHGDIWGEHEFHSYYDEFGQMMKEAYRRYEEGYHVQYHDKVTGETHFVERERS
jgi:hypothetical protein